MTENCMKNAKIMNDFYYEEFENKSKEISISMELVRLIISSKGSNSNEDIIEELKAILACNFIKDDCIEFENYLKGEKG